MKYFLSLCFVITLSCVKPTATAAQEFEITQLILDCQKLLQLKGILTNMYKAYTIVSEGYEKIKSISEGNFNMHELFLDELLQVSPVVQNYVRVGEIIAGQIRLVNEYKAAFNRFKSDKNFKVDEIAYIGDVYSNLVDKSLGDLDALLVVITAGTLRMSDEERLHAIDEVYASMQDKLGFLQYFNNGTTILAVQRARDANDVNTIKNVYGLTQ